MTNKMKVLDRVKSIKATIEISKPVSGSRYICIDAPPGKRWTTNGCHCLVNSWSAPSEEAEAWDDALDRMGYGLEDCPVGGDDDCRISDCPAAPAE